MELQDQSYGGQIFRPTPEVFSDPQSSLCVVATPWGQRSAAKKFIEIVVNFYLSANTDRESTSPFEKDLNLSGVANILKAATRLANEAIYQEINIDEYRSGCEIFVGARLDNELSFLQVGQPQIFLARPRLPLIPLAAGIDLGTTLSREGELLPPLPHQVIGLEKTLNANIQTLTLHSEDSLVLLSRSFCPPRFLSQDGADVTTDHLADHLVTQDPSMPFWLGVLK